MSQCPSFNQATGRIDTHIDPSSLAKPVHRDLVAPLLTLQEAAAREGFSLALASGFRSFDRQLSIWNAKARGQRAVLNDLGDPMDAERLSDEALLHAILRWSALPGASRHHWGSDVDVYDAAAVGSDYQVQLTCSECDPGGPFAAFHRWLSDYLEQDRAFYRPYGVDAGGVAPEPWHLSYRPLAEGFLAQLNEAALKSLLEATDIALKPVILENFSSIYTRYVVVPC